MTTISTGNFPSFLVQGMRDVAGATYKQQPQLWRMFADVGTSIRNYDEEAYIVETGLATEKNLGNPIDFDDASQHYIAQYRQKTYGLGMRVNFEAIEDNLYKDKLHLGSKMLVKSYAETQNVVGHNILNNAFSSAIVYGDGKPLISDTHPFLSGGTWSNKLATAANLSQQAIEDLLIQISELENDKGHKIVLSQSCLHVPPALQFKAARILDSVLQSDTAENAKNVLKGLFPQGNYTHPHFTSTKAWFIKTNAEKGIRYIERKAWTLDQDNDFTTKDLLFSIHGRYAFGVTDPRGVFGSEGV